MARYLVLVTFNKGKGTNQEHRDRGNQSKAWVQQHQASGVIESAYTFSAGDSHQGGCAIVQANSQGDLQSWLRTNPASPSVSYETHELVEYSSGVDQLIGMQ